MDWFEVVKKMGFCCVDMDAVFFGHDVVVGFGRLFCRACRRAAARLLKVWPSLVLNKPVVVFECVLLQLQAITGSLYGGGLFLVETLVLC